jgi:hypothetical protein
VCSHISRPEQDSANVSGYYIIRNFVEILGFHRGVVEVSVLPGYCDASLGDWDPIIHFRGVMPKKTLRNFMIYVIYVSVYVARIVKHREIEGVGNTARDNEEKGSIYNPWKTHFTKKLNRKLSRIFGNNVVKV